MKSQKKVGLSTLCPIPPMYFILKWWKLTLYEKKLIWVTFHSMISKNIMTLFAKLLIWVIFAVRKRKKNLTQISFFVYWVTFPFPTSIENTY